MSDEPGESASAKKSEGQQLLDRLLATCNRLNKIADRLDEAKASITPSSRKAPQPGVAESGSGSRATSLFQALNLIADSNDKIADRLDASVEDLAGLF